MTPADFTVKHGAAFQEFLKSEMGKDFISAIESMRMTPECDPNPHQVSYRLGGIAGYEDCISKILRLGIPYRKFVEPRQNYQVRSEKMPTEGVPSL